MQQLRFYLPEFNHDLEDLPRTKLLWRATMRNKLFLKSYKLWLVNVCKYLCHFMLTQVSSLRDLDADVCWGLQALRFGICFAMAWFGTLEKPMIGVWWKEICGTRRLLKFRRYSCVWSFYGRLVETMMSVHWPWCNQYCIGMAHGSIYLDHISHDLRWHS